MAKNEEYRDYNEKTFEELDAEVEEAFNAERRQKFLGIAIFLLVTMFLFPNAWLFLPRFSFAFPSGTTNEVIDVTKAPIWTDLPDNKPIIIPYKSLEDDTKVELRALTEYSVSGRVVAKNYFFWGNYLPGGRRTFQSVSLYDLGLVWGDLADLEILKNYYTFYSAKSAAARALYPTLRRGVKVMPYSWHEINSQFSHTHIIPASRSIMAALVHLRKYQPVKLEGYLVDVVENGRTITMTSFSNSDTNATSRGANFGEGVGGGACEVMFVKRLVVGDMVYE